MKHYEVTVIGAGIAGSEAAFFTARSGLNTLIINISMDNPGLLKYSAKIDDNGEAWFPGNETNDYILFKDAVLNSMLSVNIEKTSENTRCSFIVDKRKLSLYYKYSIENRDLLDTRQGLATNIEINQKGNNVNYKITLNDGDVYFSDIVIISAGTFFNGNIFWGNNIKPAGRHGEINSEILYKNLLKMGYKFLTDKVFIGPRIDIKSLDLKKLDKVKIHNYSKENTFQELKKLQDFGKQVNLKNVFFYKSKTIFGEINEIIKNIQNKYYSEKPGNIFYGINDISDEKQSNQQEIEIELTQEGNDTAELYVNNLCCPYSETEQYMILKRFPGLENVEITRPGYFIKYEKIIPENIGSCMESTMHKNIYFAGEVTGPGSYDKIVRQGLAAGTGASASIGKKI